MSEQRYELPAGNVLATLCREYCEIYERFRDGVVAAEKAPYFEDAVARTNELKSMARIAGIFAVRSFVLVHVGENFAFQHELGLGRHLDIDRLALDELDRTPGQCTRHVELVDLHRHLGVPATLLARADEVIE